MPIYEYKCPKCNHVFEEWVKNVQDENAEHYDCPQCHTSSNRLISPTTFILKGGGWYVTEYGNHGVESDKNEKTDENKSSDAEKTDEKSTEKSSEKSESKSVEKPAEKSENKSVANKASVKKASDKKVSQKNDVKKDKTSKKLQK